MIPQIDFHPLTRADGSTTYSDQLFAVLTGVNGPVEVQRRDELPEEAAIEVNIRPLSGIGGPRERWLEDIVQSVLRSLVLVHLYPRTLVQVTLQITQEPVKTSTTKTDIAILPTLINAAFSGLIDAGLPLRTTAVATLVAVTEDGSLVHSPKAPAIQSATSLHAMAYDMSGALLLNESIGAFTFEQWETVANEAHDACAAAFQKESDELMTNTDIVTGAWLRQALQEKVRDAV